MNCTKCNTPLKENAKFCTKCGQKVMVNTQTSNEGKNPESPKASDINSVNGRICWNIQPGQIARIITESEINSYKNVHGIVIQEGTKAFIRANGKTIASISGGSYEIGNNALSTANSLKNKFSNAWNWVISLLEKNEKNKPIDVRIQEQQQESILQYAKNEASFSVIMLLEKAFPLLIGQKQSTPDNYMDILPMKIQSQFLDLNLILNAYFKISDHETFILHYLSNRKELNTTTIVHEIADSVKRAIQDSLWDKEVKDNLVSNEVYTEIKEHINAIAAETFFGLSLVRIVEISSDNKDLDRLRALSAEIYLSENELDYLNRTNRFKNRLAETVNSQRLHEARTEQELLNELDEINKDRLLHEDELEKFKLVLKNERLLYEATKESERDAALSELYKSDLLRAEEVDILKMQIESDAQKRNQALLMMRLHDSIEFERVRLEGESEKAVSVAKGELAKQGLFDEYADNRFYKELEKQRTITETNLDIEQRKRDIAFNDEKRRHEMQKEDDDTQFKQFMSMLGAEEQARENQRRHEAEMEHARLKNAENMGRLQWESAKELSEEKIWALKGGDAAVTFAENKYRAEAERESSERLALQKKEDEARIDRERASRDAEHKETQSQMFQMMRDMMTMTGNIQAQKTAEKERQLEEKEERIQRQESRMDTAYDRALDYTTKNNVQANSQRPASNQTEKRCPDCDAKIEAETKFCADCGAEIL